MNIAVPFILNSVDPFNIVWKNAFLFTMLYWEKSRFPLCPMINIFKIYE